MWSIAIRDHNNHFWLDYPAWKPLFSSSSLARFLLFIFHPSRVFLNLFNLWTSTHYHHLISDFYPRFMLLDLKNLDFLFLNSILLTILLRCIAFFVSKHYSLVSIQPIEITVPSLSAEIELAQAIRGRTKRVYDTLVLRSQSNQVGRNSGLRLARLVLINGRHRVVCVIVGRLIARLLAGIAPESGRQGVGPKHLELCRRHGRRRRARGANSSRRRLRILKGRLLAVSSRRRRLLLAG